MCRDVCRVVFLRYGDHRDLHVLPPPFPTRRSSYLIASSTTAWNFMVSPSIASATERAPVTWRSVLRLAAMVLVLLFLIVPHLCYRAVRRPSPMVMALDRKSTRLNSSH